MTKSEIFKTAHNRAKEDFAYNSKLPEVMRKSYAYYFRLQLIGMYYQPKAFEVHSKRTWA